MNPFQKEAVILYALTHGHLDNIEINDIARFESELYRSMDITPKGIEISKIIKETKALPEDNMLDDFIKAEKHKFI